MEMECAVYLRPQKNISLANVLKKYTKLIANCQSFHIMYIFPLRKYDVVPLMGISY